MEAVNHPPHYNQHPSGVEAVDLCEHLSFNLGNALKYLWRADHKGKASEDHEKAAWYLRREAARTERQFVSMAARPLADRVLEHEASGSPLAQLLEAIGESTLYSATLVRIATVIEGRRAA